MDVEQIELQEKPPQESVPEVWWTGEPGGVAVFTPAPTAEQQIAQLESRIADLDTRITERIAELEERIGYLERDYELLDEVQYQLRSSGMIE